MKKKKNIPVADDANSVGEIHDTSSAEEVKKGEADGSDASLCDGEQIQIKQTAKEALESEKEGTPVLFEVSEEEPAVSRKPRKPLFKKETIKKFFSHQGSKAAVALVAVFALAALIVTAVNLATKDKVTSNEGSEKQIAMLSIFDRGTHAEHYETLDDGREVHLVHKNDALIGYCVFLDVQGFVGNIKLAVGIDANLCTYGVRILSMSETQGSGAKIKTGEFLERFNGLSQDEITKKVDVIAGATVSSEAVKSAVASALEINLDLGDIAAEKGVELLLPDEFEEEESISADESESVSSTEDSTVGASDGESSEVLTNDTEGSVTPETNDPEETTDAKFVHNGGEKYHDYVVEATTVDDRYVIEIPKEEETSASAEQASENN